MSMWERWKQFLNYGRTNTEAEMLRNHDNYLKESGFSAQAEAEEQANNQMMFDEVVNYFAPACWVQTEDGGRPATDEDYRNLDKL